MLSSKERAFLRGLAHDKKAVILIGHKGVSAAVLQETAGALLTHELIKVRLAEGDKDALDAQATAIAGGTGAELIARTGRTVILYKRHPDAQKAKVMLPRKKKKDIFDVVED